MTDSLATQFEALNPCPWCLTGRNVRPTNVQTAGSGSPGEHAVTCDRCLCCGPIMRTEAEAVAAWNHRAQISAALRGGEDGWMQIETAPKDGTRVLIRFEHMNYKYADAPEDKARWEEVCIAHWIDHNSGGWTWHGICGAPTKWRPLPDSPVIK